MSKLTIEQVRKAAPRFWSRVKVGRSDECWDYQGSRSRQGYGQIGIGPRPHGAHRVAWMLGNDRLVPSNLFICHTCDNRSCCNPDHLFAGTHEDNMSDLVKKGHARGAAHRSGEAHWRAVLTEQDVLDIRSRYATKEPVKQIAEEYGVTVAMCSVISSGSTWKHVGGPIRDKDYIRHRTGFKRRDIWIEWV